jgi:hypothetical protein
VAKRDRQGDAIIGGDEQEEGRAVDTAGRSEEGCARVGRGAEAVGEDRETETKKAPITLPPWQENPYSPVSLFAMLSFSAWAFYQCGIALRSIVSDCYVASIPFDRDKPIFALPQPIDGLCRQKAIDGFMLVETAFRKIALNVTADTVGDVLKTLRDHETRRNYQWLIDQALAIERLGQRELDNKLFIYVPAERSRYFPTQAEPYAFGETVATAFPTATSDIHEAANCLALARGTAAVFHLMRVLNVGLAVLCKEFGVTLSHTNWGTAIPELESKIRDMHRDPKWKALPDCKEQQQYFSQAASHFGILKDAWRNYTMHEPVVYTEERAELIFANTKAFMQTLSERLKE